MARLALIHSKTAAVEAHLALLRKAGHRVESRALTPATGPGLLTRDPPEAYVVDLDRAPSLGRDAALYLRQRKTTRHLPIVFAGGAEEKVAPVRALLPDAVYTSWGRVRGAVRGALRRPPAARGAPASPGALAGYSGPPLPKKLGLKAGATLALLGAPAGFEAALEPLPEGVRVRRQARGSADLVLPFVTNGAELARRFSVAEHTLATGGGLWIAWPKKASGRATDLTQATVRAHGLDAGLVDYKICAIDETWSGLKFARRAGSSRSTSERPRD